MATKWVEDFIHALSELETRGDSTALLGLFDDPCEIENVAIDPLHGKDGVTRFWENYRKEFADVRTQFTRVTEAGAVAFLEWTSEGTFPSGKPVRYEGLTVLESRDGRICRMKAYHDSAAFVHHRTPGGDEAARSSTDEVMRGLRREESTPSEGILTSTLRDRDAATS